MKKIIMGLAILGLTSSSAAGQQTAQTKSKFDINYPVCETKNKNGYTVCSKAQMNAQLKKMQAHKDVSTEALPETNQVVYVRCQSVADEPQTPGTTYAAPGRHRIQVSYDNMDNPYKGLPSRQYDGPAKNDERNLNVNQSSIDLPPSNGYTAK